MNIPGATEEDEISNLIQKAWYNYDVDRSGYLDKRETLRFLNDLLMNQGQQSATLPMFNRFFSEFDTN